MQSIPLSGSRLRQRWGRFMFAAEKIKAIVEEALPESFVFYKPKDIVSGDFYWVSKTKSDQVLIAVGDCTGHGVPGGLMSIMGTAFINELVSEKPDISPSELLNDLRLRVIDGLQQKGVAGEARDGMDISLCLLNTFTCPIDQYIEDKN